MIREYKAETHRVIDGDTIVFDLDLGFKIKKRATIRVLGVDTAETYGVSHDSKEYKAGKKQAKFVKNWLEEADSLTVRTDEKGKYGRWLGEIHNDKGKSLNDLLLEKFDIDYE